jgi:succinate dehydrogenase hydrophobic anchor subunit
LICFHIAYFCGIKLLALPPAALASPIPPFLYWLFAFPMVFHAFNGARLMLYESFGSRNDERMLRWMAGLSLIYLGVLGLLMLMGDQRVSPFLFWLITAMGALALSYETGVRIWKPGHALFWKFQRITASFLLVTVPAYLLFIVLIPHSGRDTGTAISGLQRPFTAIVYLAILVGALYHGGYGVWSFLSGYCSSRSVRKGLAFFVVLVIAVFFLIGLLWIFVR